MKNDIDFDELDRAVNSLMGGVAGSSSRGSDEAPEPKTLSISTTLKPGEKPAYERVGEVAKRIGSETLTTDNDATTITDIGEISQPELQPVAVPVNVPQQSQSTAPKPQSNIRPNSSSEGPVAPRPSGGRFMDVVHPSSDMKTSLPQQAPTPVVTSSVPTERVEPPAPTVTPDIELTSPFLADAKVEKRPLGGESTPPVKEDDYSHNDMPEEIVAINSEAIARHNLGNNTQEILDASQFESVSSVDKQIQAIEANHEATLPDSQSDEIRAVESVDSGATATQQGAIFDVNDYHQPLNHPPKQKSGWGVVVIIVIIIILASAIGAGAYFLLGLGN